MAYGMSNPIRLLIIDDHPVFRESLAHALGAAAGFEVIAQANDGAAAVGLWQRHQPDVTLMDVRLVDVDGVAAVRRILATAPAARVLMLSSSEDDRDAFEALEAGAAGYITKSVGFLELLEAIREVHAGGRPIGEEVARRLAAREKGGPLSPRETEVLLLLRDGLSEKEICRRLAIADRTVRAHVAAIKEKLDASSTAHCVTRGFELGLLSARSGGGKPPHMPV
jgi:two-component system, NarL family, response regulator